MDSTASAVVLLASALFIALVVERLMEIAKAFYDFYEIRRDGYRRWNQRAAVVQRQLHELITSRSENDIRVRLILARLQPDDPAYSGTPAISAERLRNMVVRNTIKTAGIVVGVIIALLAEINMFLLIDRMLGVAPQDPAAQPWLYSIAGTVFTGIAMGLGSAPLHKIIAALERAKQRRTATVGKES